MQRSEGPGRDGGAAHLEPLALAVWASVAAIAVVALFPLLHSYIGHATSIIVSGLAGMVVGAFGYGWRSGDRSGRGLASAGALGGGLGMLALHVLPLLR